MKKWEILLLGDKAEIIGRPDLGEFETIEKALEAVFPLMEIGDTVETTDYNAFIEGCTASRLFNVPMVM